MKILISLLSSVLLLGTHVLAEDSLPAPQGFYDHKFVTEPAQATAPLNLEEKQVPAQETTEVSTQGKSVSLPSVTQSREINEQDSIPVNKIHLLVEATNPQNLFDMIQQYRDTLIQYRLRPGDVYLFGAVGKLPLKSDEILQIVARGGKLRVNYEVAKRYNITKSPSWILETEEGDIVLESYQAIDRFLTSKGAFRKDRLPSEQS